MPRFIEGEDRTQASLFPERLDDYIAEDNPVRLVEAFVDGLDLKALGFKRDDVANVSVGAGPQDDLCVPQGAQQGAGWGVWRVCRCVPSAGTVQAGLGSD